MADLFVNPYAPRYLVGGDYNDPQAGIPDSTELRVPTYGQVAMPSVLVPASGDVTVAVAQTGASAGTFPVKLIVVNNDSTNSLDITFTMVGLSDPTPTTVTLLPKSKFELAYMTYLASTVVLSNAAVTPLSAAMLLVA